MNTYGVKPEGYKVIQKRVMLGGYLSLAVALLSVGFLVKPASGRDFVAFGLTAVTVLIFGVVVFTRNVRRIREVWSTYTLTIGEDYILKQQSHYPDIRIGRDEMKVIQKAATGDIVVKTRDWRRFIIIPRSLHGLAEVEHLLGAWMPIKLNSGWIMVLAASAAVFFFLGCLGAIRYFLSGQKPSLMTIYGVVIVVMILALVGMRELRRIPNLDDRAKPKRWQFLLLLGYIFLLLISMAVFHLLKR